MPLIIHLFVFFSDQVQSRQSFTSLRYQYIDYKMVPTTPTKQHDRSSPIIKPKPDDKKKNTQRDQTLTSLGSVVWNQTFSKNSIALPTTKFMERLKQALKEEDYHHINQEILKRLENNKDEFCTKNYDTLTNVINKLYYILTRAIIKRHGRS